MRWLLAFMLLAPMARAQKVLMENTVSSGGAFKVNTSTGRVTIATSSYTGAVSNVALYVSSNIAIGTLANKDACVIYATGSITCLGVVLGGSGGAVTIAAGSTLTISAPFTNAGTTVTIGNSAGCAGVYCRVVSTFNPVAIGSVTITGLNSTDTWRFRWQGHITGTSYPILRINSDAASNYSNSDHTIRFDGLTGTEGTSGTSRCTFSNTATTMAADDWFNYNIEVSADPDSNKNVTVTIDGSFTSPTATSGSQRGISTCWYKGASNFTTITFQMSNSAITWRGRVEAWRAGAN